jgi:hypothetical protein
MSRAIWHLKHEPVVSSDTVWKIATRFALECPRIIGIAGGKVRKRKPQHRSFARKLRSLACGGVPGGNSSCTLVRTKGCLVDQQVGSRGSFAGGRTGAGVAGVHDFAAGTRGADYLIGLHRPPIQLHGLAVV